MRKYYIYFTPINQKTQKNQSFGHIPFTKLSQKTINILTRPIMGTGIEPVTKSLPTKKSSRQISTMLNSTKYFRKNLTPILCKLFKTMEREAIFSNSFQKTNTTLIPMQGIVTTEEENYTLISLKNIYTKISNRVLTLRVTKMHLAKNPEKGRHKRSILQQN